MNQHLDYWLFENQQPSSKDLMFDSLPVLTSDTSASPALSDLDAPFEPFDPLTDSLSTSYPPYASFQVPLSYGSGAFQQEQYGFPSQIPPTPAITDADSEDISPMSSPMIPKAEPGLDFPSLHTIPTITPAEPEDTKPAREKEKHTTSSRRRAQNRRAQRAFRERKERYAKDLEAKLADMTEKYTKLEKEHIKLEKAYKDAVEGKRSKRGLSMFEGD